MFFFLPSFPFIIIFFLYLYWCTLYSWMVEVCCQKKNWMPERLKPPSNRTADVYALYYIILFPFISLGFLYTNTIAIIFTPKNYHMSPYALNVTHVCTSLYLFTFALFSPSLLSCTHNILTIHKHSSFKWQFLLFSYSISVIQLRNKVINKKKINFFSLQKQNIISI